MERSKRIYRRLRVFSARECEVLKLAATGLNTKQIAVRLNVEVDTINTHKQRMMRKIDAQNFTKVIYYSATHEIIDMNKLAEYE